MTLSIKNHSQVATRSCLNKILLSLLMLLGRLFGTKSSIANRLKGIDFGADFASESSTWEQQVKVHEATI